MYKTSFDVMFKLDKPAEFLMRLEKGTARPVNYTRIAKENLSPKAILILEAYEFAVEGEGGHVIPVISRVFDHVPTPAEMSQEIADGKIDLGILEVNFRDLVEKFLRREASFSELRHCIDPNL